MFPEISSTVDCTSEAMATQSGKLGCWQGNNENG